jgi:hypothetical protein
VTQIGPSFLLNCGRVDIDGASCVMTVTLRDVGDQDLRSLKIEPAEPRLAVKFAQWK